MKQTKIVGFLLDEDYIIINSVMYRLEKLNTEQMVEAITNGGDVLPIIPQGLANKPV